MGVTTTGGASVGLASALGGFETGSESAFRSEALVSAFGVSDFDVFRAGKKGTSVVCSAIFIRGNGGVSILFCSFAIAFTV